MVTCGLALSCLSVALTVLVTLQMMAFLKTEAEKLLFNAQYLQIILLLFNTSVHVGINIRQA